MHTLYLGEFEKAVNKATFTQPVVKPWQHAFWSLTIIYNGDSHRCASWRLEIPVVCSSAPHSSYFPPESSPLTFLPTSAPNRPHHLFILSQKSKEQCCLLFFSDCTFRNDPQRQAALPGKPRWRRAVVAAKEQWGKNEGGWRGLCATNTNILEMVLVLESGIPNMKSCRYVSGAEFWKRNCWHWLKWALCSPFHLN